MKRRRVPAAAGIPAAFLERIRERLAGMDALVPMALIGAASGVFSGLIIVAFRLLTETTQSGVLTGSDPEAFETLPWFVRLALPVAGGAIIGLIFERIGLRTRQVGVAHVMERLALHAGRLPWRNAIVQFLGAALALLFGHSVGREGPVVHVGAASASIMGQWLGLPHNYLRTLVACGTAAAISASFNTPVAGVVFAMEVVLMEYTVVGFVPVILAAVSATSISQAVYGAAPAFHVPDLHIASLLELPYVILLGVLMGVAATGFSRGIRFVEMRLRGLAVRSRMIAAGACAGCLAAAVPEIMGVGYDTVEAAFLGRVALGSLALVASVKLIATAVCVGAGIPGGLIGPSVVIGATFGGAVGVLGHTMVPEYSAGSGLYAMLGMGAMMAATLQAPLAAIMALLELTQNAGIILPAMLAVVSACLTSRVAFGEDSAFVELLRARGIEYRPDPVTAALSRLAVSAVMSKRIAPAPPVVSREQALDLLESRAEWILVLDGDRVQAVVSAREVEAGANAEDSDAVDLLALPGTHRRLASVRGRSTLREALDRMDRRRAEVVLVTRGGTPRLGGVLGIVSREQVRASVRRAV